MQLNKLKTILVNKQKTKPQAITKKKLKKLNGMCRSRYLIS